MSDSAKITSAAGRAIPLRGNDIDTDRIMPARFLKCVVFDGLGEHVFEDDRASERAKGRVHPFDDRRYAGAEILLVNKNFGCGSSREHAPQGIKRAGIKAIAGESFAEIFFGNCVSLGIPCVTVAEADMAALMAAAESDPGQAWTVDLERSELARGTERVAVSMPEGVRKQFLTGRWNAMNELLEDFAQVGKVAASLPYVAGWKGA